MNATSASMECQKTKERWTIEAFFVTLRNLRYCKNKSFIGLQLVVELLSLKPAIFRLLVAGMHSLETRPISRANIKKKTSKHMPRFFTYDNLFCCFDVLSYIIFALIRSRECELHVHDISKWLGVLFVTGPAVARRGDCIRCTVMFDEEPDADGKIPVFFTLNGSEIILEGGENPGKSLIFMDFEKPLFPLICMTEGSRVLAKVRCTLRPTYHAIFFGTCLCQ